MKKRLKTPPPFTVLVDTREQHPLPFPPTVETRREKLYPGDYSVAGLIPFIAIEKKDINDLVGTLVGKSDKVDGSTIARLQKFAEELTAMANDVKRYSVVVTQPLRMIEAHLYQSSVPPQNIIRMITDLEAATGVQFKFFDSPAQAATFVLAELFQAWEFAHGLSSIKYTLRKLRPERLRRDRVKMPKPPDGKNRF